MEKIKELEGGKLVMLVKVPSTVPLLEAPHVGDYDNRYILKTIPCVKVGNKYLDVRYGKKVEKDADTLEWLLMTGNVLQYPDGKNILLSRCFSDDKVFCLEISKHEFHPESMIMRPLISRTLRVRKT